MQRMRKSKTLTDLQLMTCRFRNLSAYRQVVEKSDWPIDFFPGGTKGLCGYPT
jgi:hypothetical protein